METFKFVEDADGNHTFVCDDWRISAWEAPSGTGITCHIFSRHYPYTSTVIRGLESFTDAEIVASRFILTH